MIFTSANLCFYSAIIALSLIIIFLLIFLFFRPLNALYSGTVKFIHYLFYVKTDFILKIAPSKKTRFKTTNQAHYPPPGYGFPYNKRALIKDDEQPDRYSMFLAPGRLGRWYLLMTLGVSLASFIPLSIYWFVFSSSDKAYYIYSGAIYITTIISIIVPLIGYWFLRRGKTVLKETWAIWPEPCNHMLSSVPHKVVISRKDKKNKKLKEFPIYWNPKTQISIFRQPKQYAPDSPTLQGVLLNFAVFEVFFDKPSNAGSSSNVFNISMWAKYWMLPVWSSYFLLTFGMIVYFILTKSLDVPICPSSKPNAFLLEGGSFILGISLWIISTSSFIRLRLDRLADLKNKVCSGYFEQHEDLVPQQVLNQLADIPTELQISNVIDKAGRFYQFLIFGAFVNFLLIFDALK